MLAALIIGISGALVAVMLYEFMGEGMIFERYGKWVDTLDEWYAKPIGGCLNCFTVWCVLFMGVAYIWVWPVWLGLTSLAIGNFCLTIMDRCELL